MERLVPTQSNCRMLKENGWDKPTYYYIWVNPEDNKPVVTLTAVKTCSDEQYYHEKNIEWYYAPTISELLDELPESIDDVRGVSFHLTLQKLTTEEGTAYPALYESRGNMPEVQKGDILGEQMWFNAVNSLACLWVELKSRKII